MNSTCDGRVCRALDDASVTKGKETTYRYAVAEPAETGLRLQRVGLAAFTPLQNDPAR